MRFIGNEVPWVPLGFLLIFCVAEALIPVLAYWLGR